MDVFDITRHPTLGTAGPASRPLTPMPPAMLQDLRPASEIYRAQAELVRDIRHKFAKMARLLGEINDTLVTWSINDYELQRREALATLPAGPSPHA